MTELQRDIGDEYRIILCALRVRIRLWTLQCVGAGGDRYDDTAGAGWNDGHGEIPAGMRIGSSGTACTSAAKYKFVDSDPASDAKFRETGLELIGTPLAALKWSRREIEAREEEEMVVERCCHDVHQDYA